MEMIERAQNYSLLLEWSWSPSEFSNWVAKRVGWVLLCNKETNSTYRENHQFLFFCS